MALLLGHILTASFLLYFFEYTDTGRTVQNNVLGRRFVSRNKNTDRTGIVHVNYCSRAMEWVNMKQLFSEIFTQFSIPHMIPLLLNIMFAWNFCPNVAKFCYRPALVFKDFSVNTLINDSCECICNSSKRLVQFLDTDTMDSNVDGTKIHVRTMDTKIIHNHGLREAITLGLNHIPLRNTNIREAIQVVMDSFGQVCSLLRVDELIDMDLASKMVRAKTKDKLVSAMKENLFGFRYSKPYLFSEKTVVSELSWLLKHVFISGLDKATSNACFICISHIRNQALLRLSSPDFEPCRLSGTWESIDDVTSKVKKELTSLLPELPIHEEELPYIMGIYKFHKKKYRWISNAFGTMYVNIATLLTISTMALLVEVKEWAATTVKGYRNFLGIDTSIYWIIDSITDFTLNIPEKINNMYVADITRCFESIPVSGSDTLYDAMEFITHIGISNMKRKHPKSEYILWVKINNQGLTTKAIWASTCPKYGEWFPIPISKFLQIHKWLTTNCYVRLGDRVWKQILGIPMGFSCSPLWCNLYLMSYEIKFIQRLARLGQTKILSKFKHAYRYIDDLCWINVGEANIFLDPTQPRHKDNPLWIYPLDILEIKAEVSQFSINNPLYGIKAHFMNVLLTVTNEELGSFIMQKYDKRRELPFSYSQYIKFKSNRPVKQAYNVAISQTVPILYLSNNQEVALQEIHALFTTLSANGFRFTKLQQIVTKFLNDNQFPALRFDKDQLLLRLQGMYFSLLNIVFHREITFGCLRCYNLYNYHESEGEIKQGDWYAYRKWMHYQHPFLYT